MPSIIKTNAFETSANAYTFCPKCGVDVTIYSHEDDCPCVRHTALNNTYYCGSEPVATATTKQL